MSRFVSIFVGVIFILASLLISIGLIGKIQSQTAGSNVAAPLKEESSTQSGLATTSKVPVSNQAYSEEENLELTIKEIQGFRYDPTGRRDPFKPFGESKKETVDLGPSASVPADLPANYPPLQLYDLSQFKVVAISWDHDNPKALISDPSGKQHLIRKETRIGRNRGFVAEIREGEIVVIEPVENQGVTNAQTRILSIYSSKEGGK
jgi:Tfp pilus assembly protein PilP